MTNKFLCALTGVAMLAVSPAASASMLLGPQLCVPDADKAGPKWWKPTANPKAIDLRFATGASLGPVQNEATAQARILWDPHHERALVRVAVTDVESLDPEDAFVFVVSDAAGVRPELLVRFRPLQGCTDPLACRGNGVGLGGAAIDYAHATATTSLTWTALSPHNPMADRTVTHPWIQTRQYDEGQFGWTLTFAVDLPTDGAGDIAAQTRVFGSVVERVDGPTSTTELELPVLCESGSPTSDECAMVGIGDIELPDDLPLAVESSWVLLSSDC